MVFLQRIIDELNPILNPARRKTFCRIFYFSGMTNRVAVMDLGTNTFHLLIAEPDAHLFFKEIKHDYAPVKLGEGGINEGTIKPEAYERGINTLKRFNQHIQHFGASQVKAIATSAVRSAANGEQFINDVKAATGINIETINGDTEAGYIYQGVKASGCLHNENSLIVDIGGGSVEFIICNRHGISYKQSFEIGAARLMAMFHTTDPIPPDAVSQLNAYLDEKLQPVFDAVEQFPISDLIGSSGAFETFAELVEVKKGEGFDLKQTPVYNFDIREIKQVTDMLIQSNHQQRAAEQGIIPVRVDMIVVASLLTRFLTSRLNLQKVVMTAFSLKEGVLAELFAVNDIKVS